MIVKKKLNPCEKKLSTLSATQIEKIIRERYPRARLPKGFVNQIPREVLTQLICSCEHKTVHLLKDWGPDGNPSLPRNGCSAVRWINNDLRGHRLEFVSSVAGMPDWPFIEAPQPIFLEPGATSAWFTMLSSTPAGAYTYNIIPQIIPVGSSGPPDGPSVEAE